MNLPSGQEKRKNEELEERLGKLEGRHFRMLNRISNKLAQEKIAKNPDEKNYAKKELYNFMRNPHNHHDTPLLVGVRSALYSKLDESIKNTLFDNANLGLVITNGDVKTNYDIQNVQNFMTHGKIENYCSIVDGIDNPAFSGINITNSKMLKYSENKNAIIGQDTSITAADMLEHSKNDFCIIGGNSIMNYSKINNHSKNKHLNLVENAIITGSLIGNYSTNTNSDFAKNATINDRHNDLKTIINTYSTKDDRK